MFRTFGFGVVLGLVAAAAAANYLPLFDLQREVSVISVQPNGGNAELFRIQLPADRIVSAHGDQAGAVPAGLVWPDAPQLAAVGVDVYKIRNTENRVVGVASRIGRSPSQAAAVSEWTLYLPARGAMYVPVAVAADGAQVGNLRAGTREFAMRRGTLTVHHLADASEDAPEGHIELRAVLISTDYGESGEETP